MLYKFKSKVTGDLIMLDHRYTALYYYFYYFTND